MGLALRYAEDIFRLISWGLEQLMVQIEGFSTEELVDKRKKNFLVILVVDFASENWLGDQGAEGVPGNLVRVNLISIISHFG